MKKLKKDLESTKGLEVVNQQSEEKNVEDDE